MLAYVTWNSIRRKKKKKKKKKKKEKCGARKKRRRKRFGRFGEWLELEMGFFFHIRLPPLAT